MSCVICGKNESEVLYNRGTRKRGEGPVFFNNFICKNCGLVYRDTAQKVSPKEYVEECYAIDSDTKVLEYLKHVEDRSKDKANLEFLKKYLKPDTRVLEIGSGFGLMLKDVAGLGCKVRGVEPSTSGRYAEEKFNLPIFHGTLEQFLSQGGSEKFDVILMHHVFEHFEDPLKTLREIEKILAPGGLLYVEVPNILNFDRAPDDFFDFWHYYNYSPGTLSEMLKKGGFKIIDINRKKPARIQIIAARIDSTQPPVILEEDSSYKKIKQYIYKKVVLGRIGWPKFAKKIKKFWDKYKMEAVLAFICAGLQGIAFWLTAAHGSFMDINDAETYLRVAKNLFKYGGFFYNPETGNFFAEMPLYPLFIALFYSVIPKIWFVILVQNTIAMLAVFYVFRLGKIIFGKEVGFFAALFFAFDMQRLYFSNQIMTEILFTFLFIIALYFFLRFEMEGKKKYLIFGSFFLGLSVLTRPTTQYFIFFLIAYLLVRGLNKKSFKQFVFLALLACLVYGVTISPWLIRNKIHFGQTKSTSTGEFNLYAAYAVYFLEYKYKGEISEADLYLFTKGKFIKDVERGVFEGKAKPLVYEYTPKAMKDSIGTTVPIPPEKYNYYDPKYSKYYLTEFLKIISIDYFVAIKLYFKEAVRFFIDSGFAKALAKMTRNVALPPRLIYPYLWWAGRALCVFIYLIIFAGLFTMRRHLKEKKWPLLFLMITVFYIAAISALTNPGEFPRYRLPIAPVIYCFLSYSLFGIYNHLRKKRL